MPTAGRSTIKSLLAFLCLSAATAQTVIPPAHLNPPGSNGLGAATGINSLGVVTGYYGTNGTLYLYTWQNGTFLVAGQLIPGGVTTGPINTAGQVLIPDGIAQVWQNGIFTPLQKPNSASLAEYATSISDQGVAGCFLYAYPAYLATSVVWKDYRFSKVRVGPAISDCAFGINNLGETAGFKQNGTIFRGYVTSNGTVTEIRIGEGGTQANAINDAGQVVGFYYAQGSNVPMAFLWQNGTWQQLTVPGVSSNTATGIDSTGRVLIVDQNYKGYVWSKGNYYTLDQSYRANAISAVGDVGIVAGQCDATTTPGPCLWYVP